MSETHLIGTLFLVAPLYDGALDAAFLLVPREVYRLADVTPPNHWGYVRFPAALLLIFALMFLAIARHVGATRSLGEVVSDGPWAG
jgi:hypothetical protein